MGILASRIRQEQKLMPDPDVKEQATIMVRSEKRIIPYEEGNDPELEPLFANHFELFMIGTEIYLDIGIVRPGDIANLKAKPSVQGELPTVTFNVLERIAMSHDAFQRLKAGVDVITKATRVQNVNE
jgi:hypothetical protein